jgi:hypothetical protein
MENNKRGQALIITDSIGAPRKNPLTLYENTWVNKIEDYLLDEFNIKTFAYTQVGLTSKSALAKVQSQLKYYNPRIVIIQLGIVDCTPRLIRYETLQNLEKFVPRILKKTYSKLSKYLLVNPMLRNLRKRNDVPLELFINNLYNIFNKHFNNSLIFFIPIGYPNKRYSFDSKYVKDFVTLYNTALSNFSGKRFFYLKSIEELVKKNIYKIYDKKNRHLLLEGHRLLANQIILELEKNEKIFENFTYSGEKNISHPLYTNIINNILFKNINYPKNIFIFGTGQYAQNIHNHILCRKEFKIKGFIDKNIKNDRLSNIPIFDELKCNEILMKESTILIASTYENEIYKRLQYLKKNKVEIIKIPALLYKYGIKL